MSRPATLDAWLGYLETLHPKAIAMGLARVNAVYQQLAAPIACPVVTVTGTNGKGSTCALLDSMLRAAGYRVGLYTSPHLLRYNERVRVLGLDASDDDLLRAFNAVEDARIATVDASRSPTALTYFEFGTLAALWIFSRASLDALILEVGLGGRLDAVNIIDADVAVLTSVAIDHIDYLGATREHIGREKAGIFRSGKPAVIAEPHPPESVEAVVRDLRAQAVNIGRDYGYVNQATQWRYWGPRGERFGLPFPALRGAYQLANAATALVTLDLLHPRLPVSAGAMREGLLTVALPGRFEVLPGRPTVVFDVAHNPHAASVLAETLGSMGFHPVTIAVCGMLADKDIEGVVHVMRSRIDCWHLATLDVPRGASAERLRAAVRAAGVPETSIRAFPDVGSAFESALGRAGEADRIVVFGSFHTVSAATVAQRSSPMNIV